MKLNARSIWIGSICLSITSFLTIAAVVVNVSLIPIYISSRNLVNAADNAVVPSLNLTLAFESDLSPANIRAFKHLTVINTIDISRQLESAFHLQRLSLIISSINLEIFLAKVVNRKRRLIDSTPTINNKTALVIQITINYFLCGHINRCKTKLYDKVINAANNYQNYPLVIHLLFNDSSELQTSLTPCMIKSGITIGSITNQLGRTMCIVPDTNICSNGELPDLNDASIDELQNGLRKGYFTSADLVKAYLARIDEVNLNGPTLRAVIETSPTALQAADAADILRRNGIVLSPLHGIPILLKDNIATRSDDGMNTTAGSFALLGSITPDDATVAKKLRDAGAILLGKTALSEWANFRGTNIPNGWSARGGQATSAFYPRGDACGSSTGSGIAASIGLAAGTLGTETDGSIICPSNRNNLVGIKPTVGLTSRYLVIPISQNQDSIGPMCQSVADAAAILTIIAGRDNADNYTLSQSDTVPNYTQYLNKDGLKGARIGVLRKVFTNSTFGGYPDYVVSEFNRTIKETFQKLGATIVDPADLEDVEEIVSTDNEFTVFKFDFKDGLNSYLSQLKNIPSEVRTLQDLIDYNNLSSKVELPPGRDNQDLFIMAQNTTNLQDQIYIDAVTANVDRGRIRGIDATLRNYNLDALIAPAEGYTSTPAAIAGYPIITIPLGFLPNDTQVMTNENATKLNLPIWPAPNFPFGLAFIGTAYSEGRLIELAYSYEQATLTRKKSKPFTAAIPKTQLSDIICRK